VKTKVKEKQQQDQHQHIDANELEMTNERKTTLGQG
jgi:hypothetical protein